jgi:hypothetical protein
MGGAGQTAHSKFVRVPAGIFLKFSALMMKGWLARAFIDRSPHPRFTLYRALCFILLIPNRLIA